MLHPLFDHFYLVLVVLVVAVVALFVQRRRSEDRRWSQAFAAAVAVLGVFVILRFVWETPTEQITRKTGDMIDALNARDLSRVFHHVSEDFTLAGWDKAGLRSFAEQALRSGGVSEVKAWGYKVRFPRPAANEKPTGVITFSFKVKLGAEELPPMRCEAAFVRDPDGQWRMKTFQVFPLTGTEPYPITGTPLP